MYLREFSDHFLISNEVSDTKIPFEHLLVSIKASLKMGQPVVILYKHYDYELNKLKSKHFIHNDDFSFINTSLKNRFQINHKITSLSEFVDYMSDLNGLS